MSSVFYRDWKWKGEKFQKVSDKLDSGVCKAFVSESCEGLLKMQRGLGHTPSLLNQKFLDFGPKICISTRLHCVLYAH